MTEEPMESGQNQGASELPKPSYQEEVAKPTSAVAKPDAALDLEKLTPLIEELVEKKVQSTKDRRWNEVEQKYGKLSDLGKMLEDAGADPQKSAKILEGLRIQQLEQKIEELTSSPQPKSIPGKSEQDEAYEKAKGIIEAAGLNSNPRILEAMSSKYTNPSEMLIAVNTVVLEEVTGKPRATDASKVTPSTRVEKPLSAQQAKQTVDTILTSGVNVDVDALRAAAKNLED